MSGEEQKRLLKIVRRLGVVRPLDLKSQGIPRKRLYELARAGLVERRTRGIYVARNHGMTENHTFALVAKQVPHAVLCLLSALRFHDFTTQNPAEVWITLPDKARRPRLAYPRLRVTCSSGSALTEGIEVHQVEGVDVRVYSAAKTVADCFKFRNKIGLDVALEAMWDGWRSRKYTMDEVVRFGRICRVERVMEPYLQAMIA